MKWLLVILVLAFSGATHGETRIIDGDTLDLAGDRIRLFGIDAPERGEPGAGDSTAHLRRLVAGKTVTCRAIERDRYDRAVAQVRAGHAVVWCYYVRRNRPAMLATFQRAEAEAKRERRGVWTRPFRPWRDWGCNQSPRGW
jgi:endonuclease YncB( thermonuclease family)